MRSDNFRFKEIEHKYLVDDTFDLPAFRDVMATLGPTRTSSVQVRDRYFLMPGNLARRFVIRHRFDAELHHLTIKTLDSDTEIRDEVNLDLGQHAGDQAAQVDAFLDRLGIHWIGTVQKNVDVWYFPDCEVVHYRASAHGHVVRCVEFEALEGGSLADALAILEPYERATGFHGRVRSRLSLPQLLLPELRTAGQGH